MPRKKSVQRSARQFQSTVREIRRFVEEMSEDALDADVTRIHNYAVIWMYRAFEEMILDALVGAINNDTSKLSEQSGVEFPQHLTDEVCEYIVTGGGYFDFKGRDGLIKTLKGYVTDTHYLVTIVRRPTYRDALERLSALRNFAAHSSQKSRSAAKRAVGLKRLSSAGAWLKRGHRFDVLSSRLLELAQEIEDEAPY